MKRVLLFLSAFVVGMAMAALAACAMLLPGRLKEAALQSHRPAPVQVAAPAAESEPTSAPAPTPLPRKDFTDLLARNPEVVGWIAIEGTPVDFPVAQGKDNDYYLRHDLDGNYDIEGIPYADYECDVEKGRHLILYGHNMGVGETARFSSLQNYRQPEYYTRHPVVTVDTLWDSTLYKVAAVYLLTARPTDADYFAFNQYVDFADEAAAQRYLEEVAARALYTTGDYIHPDEKLLSLCLCTYEMEDARLVVMARPLRPGESTGPDAVTVNPHPRLPDRWPAGA